MSVQRADTFFSHVHRLEAYLLLGQGLLAAVIGGFFWLLALKRLYRMEWIKALAIAIVVWLIALVVGFILPTAIGPL